MTVLANEGIDNARLTGIGTPYHGKAWGIVLDIRNVGYRQLRHHIVQQVACTGTRSSTDTEHVAESQLVELILVVEVLAVVCLVGDKDYRQFGTAQDIGHIHVEVGHTVLDIHQKQHEVGLLSGYDDLFAYLLLENIVRVDHPTTSIYY